MGEKAKKIYQKIGLPRIIIIGFFLLLLFSAGPLGLSIPGLISDVINRGAMYGILVLAMVPAVQSGIGLNFGISLGIVGGCWARSSRFRWASQPTLLWAGLLPGWR